MNRAYPICSYVSIVLLNRCLLKTHGKMLLGNGKLAGEDILFEIVI